jgi:hypothetical protein
MDDRALHTILSVSSIMVPVLWLCVFRWKLWGIIPGALAFWGLTVWMLAVRSRFDDSGGAAGFLVILGGPVGMAYSGIVWGAGNLAMACSGLIRRGIGSYKGYAEAGVGICGCFLGVWRDLNKPEPAESRGSK